MKIKFEDLQYQTDAVNAVVDLFEGQTRKQLNFTVNSILADLQGREDKKDDLGTGNKIELLKEDFLENLHKVQARYALPQTNLISQYKKAYEFDIEMETGTGKTYVYLKTIFELNKKYGFKKFIIVVPSVPVKEGVNKFIEMTKDEFSKYKETYQSFIYSSSEIEKVRDFAVSPNIQIMIITIGAFNKSLKDKDKQEETKANVIYRQLDRFNGIAPVELIQETNPIVIIDEPQSVDNTPKAQEAIEDLNPSIILRYSATFRRNSNLVYKLDPIDAYSLQLVKQIEIASFTTQNDHNKPYLKLISTNNKNETAQIELDENKNGVEIKRKIFKVKQGDDLSEKTRNNIYSGYTVNNIEYCINNESVDFLGSEDILTKNSPIGDINLDDIKKAQIGKTIEEHLNKELNLNPLGIKVLSLFFIDEVKNYRYYDENGIPRKGKYAQWFEEEYKKIIKRPKYKTLFNETNIDEYITKIHNGYFAQDKKVISPFEEEKYDKSQREAEEDIYSLIMKDKEKLLSFDTPLKFIFSHSTLKEGWDNPNVFQICNLREMSGETERRQTIGRGLRLCVNQDGIRQRGFDKNTLTVIANESYTSFAKNLQNEIEQETKIKFGVIEKSTFANIPVKDSEGKYNILGHDNSSIIYEFCKQQNYIESNGKVTDFLKQAIKQETVVVPKKFNNIKFEIVRALRKACENLNIRNLNDKVEIKLNKQVYLSEDFKKLWDTIKWKTKYQVTFDSQKLISECADNLLRNIFVTDKKIVQKKAVVNVSKAGLLTKETENKSMHISDDDNELLPDIISYLQRETSLTRKTIIKILIQSKTLKYFVKNPQLYMNEVTKRIRYIMNKFIIDGIKYTKIGNDQFYTQELFNNKEIVGYLNNTFKTQKSVYSHIVYDSDKEENFARKFEDNKDIKLYVKLPGWFKIPTPLSSYNPDWAIVVDKDGITKLYFVVETKSGSLSKTFEEILRTSELSKIKCAEEHFKCLKQPVEFKVSNDCDTLIQEITSNK